MFVLFGLSLLVWLPLVLGFGILVWTTETGNNFLAAVTLIVTAVIVTIFSGIGLLELPGMIAANFDKVILFSLVYLFAGLGWSVVKWWFYARSEDIQTAIKHVFLTYKESDKDRWPTFEDYLKYIGNPLSVLNNKARITSWMVWWPLSLFWTVLDDLVLNIFNWLYDTFAGIYRAIAANQIKRAISVKND